MLRVARAGHEEEGFDGGFLHRGGFLACWCFEDRGTALLAWGCHGRGGGAAAALVRAEAGWSGVVGILRAAGVGVAGGEVDGWSQGRARLGGVVREVLW